MDARYFLLALRFITAHLDISTISISMMNKFHNQILQAFLYINTS